jgi:hypothetical protein
VNAIEIGQLLQPAKENYGAIDRMLDELNS